ncbi:MULTISPECIES: HAD family hydrolase [Inquilinus]|uniref:Hydrolase of the HAD superfamily n=1 Tax=Inquilinus ginsengisoli TaxID=363840 RepID=A0ABU1JT33_9PROT|nr:HAD family hydrolase [Inquilinus ginsengisoli]MDR6291775.1 putative hydrolase of the HAD superfamily [Inquilinus ginsengisoli]
MPSILTIAFDADDTLWHSESIFEETHGRLRALLAPWVEAEALDRTLLDTEGRNLKTFGYGVKGFTLSMIETAIDLTQGRIPAADIRTILDLGKAMMDHPVELLDGVVETLDALAPEAEAGRIRLMVVTKGDLFHQESKVARSGLAERFERIEIVAEKDEATYRRILQRSGTAPEDFLMIGNSMRSDILPVLDLGGRAVHIPYRITWAHEAVSRPDIAPPGFHTLETIRDVPGLVAKLAG